MGRLRIDIAIATFHPLVGGAEKQALLQARSLREREYEATIITFRHSKEWPAREVIEGVHVLRVAGSLLGNRKRLPRVAQRFCYVLAMLVMGWTFWRRRGNYDVLHVYQLNLLSLPAALVCWLSNKPLIVAVRSAFIGKVGNGKELALLAGPLDANEPWLKVASSMYTMHGLGDLERFGKPVMWLARFLMRKSQAIVVVLSAQMKDYLLSYDFHPPVVELIPNGVDTNRFQPCSRNDGHSERKQTVVCVSRMTYEKGNDVLLQAWGLVQKQCPQARLLLAGDGPLRERLERMARALHIDSSVEFLGQQDDIPAQLGRGAIAVLPSRYEGMPNAVLEAMACGIPCVSTRVSGSEDMIEHGVNGLLVAIEDYEDMAQALLLLLQRPELAQEMGSAARRTIEKKYALDTVIERYVRLYQRAADQETAAFEIKMKDIGQCVE